MKWSSKLGSMLRCIRLYGRDTRITISWNFSDNFKASVELGALRGDKAVKEISVKHKIYPTQLITWKRQAIDGLAGVLSDKTKKYDHNGVEIIEIHAKVGKWAVEKIFCHKG